MLRTQQFKKWNLRKFKVGKGIGVCHPKIWHFDMRVILSWRQLRNNRQWDGASSVAQCWRSACNSEDSAWMWVRYLGQEDPLEGRAWQLTPVFLPGKSPKQRSLVRYSPWGHKESDTTGGPSTRFISQVFCFFFNPSSEESQQRTSFQSQHRKCWVSLHLSVKNRSFIQCRSKGGLILPLNVSKYSFRSHSASGT